MSKHTKGPWKMKSEIEDIGNTKCKVWSIWKGSKHITSINEHIHWSNTTDEANALLITAAPDMLEALYHALDLIKNELGEGEVTEKIKLAIKKTCV